MPEDRKGNVRRGCGVLVFWGPVSPYAAVRLFGKGGGSHPGMDDRAGGSGGGGGVGLGFTGDGFPHVSAFIS